jgi:hypothetical protein
MNTAARVNLSISHLFAGKIRPNLRADGIIHKRRRQAKTVDSPEEFRVQATLG